MGFSQIPQSHPKRHLADVRGKEMFLRSEKGGRGKNSLQKMHIKTTENQGGDVHLNDLPLSSGHRQMKLNPPNVGSTAQVPDDRWRWWRDFSGRVCWQHIHPQFVLVPVPMCSCGRVVCLSGFPWSVCKFHVCQPYRWFYNAVLVSSWHESVMAERKASKCHFGKMPIRSPSGQFGFPQSGINCRNCTEWSKQYVKTSRFRK